MAQYELVYVSLSVRPLQTHELVAMLDQARSHNTDKGITGVLVYHRQEFLQQIEGECAVVRDLFERICRDRRHQQVHVLWEASMPARSFEHFSMGFVAPDDAQLAGYPGYEDLRDSGLFAMGQQPSRGRRLLISLRDDFLPRAGAETRR